jgi:hypothetical protein
MALKLTILTHKIATQLRLLAQSCTICSSRSRGQSGNLWIHPRSQDTCCFLCHAGSSLSRGRVCHVTGYCPCLCQAIYTYVRCDTFFSFLNFLYFIYIYSVSMYKPGLSAQAQLMPNTFICYLCKQIQLRHLNGRMPDRHQVEPFIFYDWRRFNGK